MTKDNLCPRRINFMYFKHGNTADKWENDRWDNSSWDSQFGEPPRTCSHCGGVHPQDAIRLLKSGMKLVLSTKYYKAYIEHSKFRPTPPIKFYTQHASEEEIHIINALHSNTKAE